MKPQFNTVKDRLIFSFGFIAFILLGMVGTFLWYSARKNSLIDLDKKLVRIENKSMEVGKLQLQFLMEESVNPVFHEADISMVRDSLYSNLQIITDLASEIEGAALEQYPESNQHFQALTLKAEEVQTILEELSQTIIERGYKDWGAEGLMRKAIHELEASPDLDRAMYGELRRREKDYIIRKEQQYVSKVKTLLREYRGYISANKNKLINPVKMLHNLGVYERNFLNLVVLDQKIGKNQRAGLRKKLFLEQEALGAEVENLRTIFTHIEWKTTLHTRWIMIFLGCALGALFIATVVLLTRSLSRPIEDLSNSIRNVVESDFQMTTISKVNKKDEVGRLSRDVQQMLDKMHERQVHIVNQNKEISLQKAQLFEANEGLEAEVEKRTERIEQQKIKLERITERISSSINYASRIQKAILPNPDLLKELFPESFLFFKPRNVLSGDFIWFKEVGRYRIVAACDCTGHGVPGALMSIINAELLESIVSTEKILSPNLILERLRSKIRLALRQEDGKNKDGMDAAIVVHDTVKNNLYYSGAKSPMIYVQNDVFHLIEGDRQSIGGTKVEKDKPFTLHTVPLTEPTQFYLGSDGFQDQFGGKSDTGRSNGKKFGRKKLRNLIEEVHSQPIRVQVQILEMALKDWMQPESFVSFKQTDDILLFGAVVAPAEQEPIRPRKQREKVYA